MSYPKALFLTGMVLISLLVGIAGFNFYRDPLCYFRCDTIEVSRVTKNVYIRAGQRILLHPETEQIVLGSSRGEVFSPQWLTKKTNLKTLNLSVEGAEVGIKSALLNLALKNLKLKKVIWIVDGFEFLEDVADPKFLNSKALRSQSFQKLNLRDFNFTQELKRYLKLIDHVTLEASQRSLGDREILLDDLGPGADIDFENCESDDFQGFTSELQLKKEVEMLFEAYQRKIFVKKISEKSLHVFLEALAQVSEAGVEFEILIPPYHPEFQRRFKAEMPEVYFQHRQVMDQLVTKASSMKNVKVINFYDGLIPADSTPRFWNDGVHFNCRAALQMLLR